jgi:hypothetical protein
VVEAYVGTIWVTEIAHIVGLATVFGRREETRLR